MSEEASMAEWRCSQKDKFVRAEERHKIGDEHVVAYGRRQSITKEASAVPSEQ